MLHQLPATNHPPPIAPNVTPTPTTTPAPNIGNQGEATATSANDDESDDESTASDLSNLSALGAWANNTHAAKSNLHSNNANRSNTPAALTPNAFQNALRPASTPPVGLLSGLKAQQLHNQEDYNAQQLAFTTA